MNFLIPYIIVALPVIVTISYCLLSRNWRVSKGVTAPEANGAWPIFGHLPLLGGSTKPLHGTLGAMADKYGPLFTVRLGIHQSLVVNSSEMAKECFTIKDTCTLNPRNRTIPIYYILTMTFQG
ncbi:putative cytochrome P450 [Rosa chinensis]|uniref:Putative cytochrome P450 n=1 Tax=Rosa chinensis TaxID=74649 RepID=A0A2P6PDK0_ROSCH|nr:putative cytochrome P450 [Rosa chinensis]